MITSFLNVLATKFLKVAETKHHDEKDSSLILSRERERESSSTRLNSFRRMRRRTRDKTPKPNGSGFCSTGIYFSNTKHQ